MWRHLKQISTQAIGLVLPQDCFICGLACGKEILCGQCRAGVQVMNVACCPRCALPNPAGALCGRCIKRLPPFDASYAAFAYTFPIREMIHALKYAHRFALTHELANALIQQVQVLSPSEQPDLVMPVPLHADRLRERGFNQAVELARILVAHTKWSFDVNSLTRVRATSQQVGLKLLQRRRNLHRAFECHKSLKGKHVLVVDDVMTTGMTLAEVARTLKAAGAARVTNFVVARTMEM